MDPLVATSSNYLSVAISDDRSLMEESLGSVKTTARQQRIAAAVQRSKLEYKPEHVYTERGATQAGPSKEGSGKLKVDRQRLEFFVSSLYYQQPPDYALIVKLIVDAIDPSNRSAGGLTRELLDTGMHAAIACQDQHSGIRLAELCRDLARGSAAGLAVSASAALLAGGLPYDAITPLLASTSSYGLHEPVLSQLVVVLDAILEQVTSEYDSDFRMLQLAVKLVLQRSRFKPRRPLFANPRESNLATLPRDDMETQTVGEIDRQVLASALSLDERSQSDLATAIRRLEKVINEDQDFEEPVGREEKGVREL